MSSYTVHCTMHRCMLNVVDWHSILEQRAYPSVIVVHHLFCMCFNGDDFAYTGARSCMQRVHEHAFCQGKF